MSSPASSRRVLRALTLTDFELSYEDSGDGPPLLLLHGFLGAGSDWAHLPGLHLLAGRRRIVPDLRGHGHSTLPSAAFRHRDAAADILALLDHLGLVRCDAIGLSGGANTLLHMASARPRSLSRMVLVSACDQFPAEARAFMEAYTLETRGAQEWAEMRARHVHGDGQIEALFRQARAFRDSHDDMNLTQMDLARITSRTLLVYGDRDPLYPLEVSLRLYCGISGAALWVLPEAGHTPVFEGDAAREFVARASAFVAGP